MTGDSGRLRIYPDVEALSAAAANFWAACSAESIRERGRFTVALSGGSTPRRLYELLATPQWRDRIDWAHCHVFWGDERMVPHTHPDSNFLPAQTALLANVPISETQIHPIDGRDDGAAPAAAYERCLIEFFGLAAGEWPRFDLLLLGLGSDGHTASLFPGFPSSEEHQKLAVATPPGTLPPPVPRVTLTLPALSAARTVLFLVAGADKADVLARVLAGDRELPAARVQPTDGELLWLVDMAAAGDLKGTSPSRFIPSPQPGGEAPVPPLGGEAEG